MANSFYSNTARVTQSFIQTANTTCINQTTSIGNNISYIKTFSYQKSEKKIKSHNEIAKIMRGFSLQKRGRNIFKRSRTIKTSSGEYAVIRSIIL